MGVFNYKSYSFAHVAELVSSYNLAILLTKLLLKDNNYLSSVIKRKLPAVIILQGCLLSALQDISVFLIILFSS